MRALFFKMGLEKQINEVITWAKKQPVKGCITGSVLLDYFDGQDVDIFLYDEKSFNKFIYALIYDPMFEVVDPLEQWKLDNYINKNGDPFSKFGLITIKFKYNTCIDINVIIKKRLTDVFSILASFDMDIISKGYDIETERTLDLTSGEGKIASWNVWNKTYYSPEIWEAGRLLRQLDRCFKYYDRGYNVDRVVAKYIELCDGVLEYVNVFNSESFNEKLKDRKTNTLIVKNLCEVWLETHEITEEQKELLRIRIRSL